MTLSDEVRALAEVLNTHLPLEPEQERLVDERYVVWLGEIDHPSLTVVQRFALRDADVEPAVDEVRSLLAARGRTTATWEVGPSSTPPDLVERLEALGMKPADEPLAVGMVLDRPPVGAEGDAVARRVDSVKEFVRAIEIAAAGFGISEEDLAKRRTGAAERFERERAGSGRATYLAWVDGEPVAFARAIFADAAVVLSGGATLEEARGRGAYRALVQARWDDAQRRGTPTLVTQAGAMSRPILQRLGFREVCEVRILLDEFG
jgi:hypothetical protein